MNQVIIRDEEFCQIDNQKQDGGGSRGGGDGGNGDGIGIFKHSSAPTVKEIHNMTFGS